MCAAVPGAGAGWLGWISVFVGAESPSVDWSEARRVTLGLPGSEAGWLLRSGCHEEKFRRFGVLSNGVLVLTWCVGVAVEGSFKGAEGSLLSEVWRPL